MTCAPERVTAYVDAELSPADRDELETHLAGCPACAEQARAERDLRERMRGLPPVEPPPGLEDKVRRGLRRSRRSALHWALPLAAGLGALVLWGRGSPRVVSWELAADHAKCFRKATVPAKIFTSDASRVRAWFAERGTRTPMLPDSAAGLEVVGARHCPLADGSSVAHVYYTHEGPHRVSVFVLDRDLRLDGPYQTSAIGETVALLRAGGLIVGLVGERPEDVEAFRRRFTTTAALALPSPARR